MPLVIEACLAEDQHCVFILQADKLEFTNPCVSIHTSAPEERHASRSNLLDYLGRNGTTPVHTGDFGAKGRGFGCHYRCYNERTILNRLRRTPELQYWG